MGQVSFSKTDTPLTPPAGKTAIFIATDETPKIVTSAGTQIPIAAAGQYPEASERENNTVVFDQNYIIGNAAARTGNILFDFTGAKLGAWTEMKHQDAAAFTFPATAVLMFASADISTTVANYFLFVLTDKTASSEVVKVFHAIEGGV